MVAASIASRVPRTFENWTCSDVFKSVPIERIAIINSGVPARWVKMALGDFMRGCGRELSVLKISKVAVSKKATLDARLSMRTSECVMGIAGLIGQVEMMVEESAAPRDFNASCWFGEWVTSPLPALGGARPIEYLDTGDGRVVISCLLAQMHSGAYA